ncbi:hypothetical protein SFC08_01845 [Lysinibacillus halotolerans]
MHDFFFLVVTAIAAYMLGHFNGFLKAKEQGSHKHNRNEPDKHGG